VADNSYQKIIRDSPAIGHVYDPFVEAMWLTYRPQIPEQPNGQENLRWVWEDKDNTTGYGVFVPNAKLDQIPSLK